MRLLTREQYHTAAQTKQALVRRGIHPATAGAMVRRAIARSGMSGCCSSCRDGSPRSGLGVHQTRSLRRDLDPSIAPRPVVSGEQCVRIQETPGGETEIYSRLNEYQQRGWTVSQIRDTAGWPSTRVYWACPPGRTPLEAQNQMLEARGWGMGADAQTVLASVAAAGDDPSVTAARNIVAKWSWLIPVGGLLMNAKSKVASMISGGNDPARTIARSGRRR